MRSDQAWATLFCTNADHEDAGKPALRIKWLPLLIVQGKDWRFVWLEIYRVWRDHRSGLDHLLFREPLVCHGKSMIALRRRPGRFHLPIVWTGDEDIAA